MDNWQKMWECKRGVRLAQEWFWMAGGGREGISGWVGQEAYTGHGWTKIEGSSTGTRFHWAMQPTSWWCIGQENWHPSWGFRNHPGQVGPYLDMDSWPVPHLTNPGCHDDWVELVDWVGLVKKHYFPSSTGKRYFLHNGKKRKDT